MTKALYGHLGGPDPRLAADLARLRRRVAELEAEVEDLRARVLLTDVTLEGADLDDPALGEVLHFDGAEPALA
jgi:hypothetical protein